MSFSFTPASKLLLCAATAASFAVAAPLAAVHAQPAYGPYTYETGPDNEITVYGARHQERDPTTGAPIEIVRASRVVYYGDLDLSTRAGAHVLRTRVARAANAACDEFDVAYPIATSDSPPCFETAYREAMEQTPVGYYRTAWYGD